MATVYVQRNPGSKIIGVYSNLQPGIATEAIDDSDPGVQQFLNPAKPTNDDQVDLDLESDKTLEALIDVVAANVSKTKGQVISEIKVARAAL